MTFLFMIWIVEKSMLFHAADAYDIHYDLPTNILQFKIKTKKGERTLKFKGYSTGWEWMSLYKGKCDMSYEGELYKIWKLVYKI